MNLKKTLAILIVASMLCSTSVSAQPFDNSELEYETVQTEKVNASSGTCGENVTWTFSGNTLTISGEGSIGNDYTPLSQMCENFPDSDLIEKLVISDGITQIPSVAFDGFSNLRSIEIGRDLEKIRAMAFLNCYRITSITVDENNEHFSNDENGVLFNKDKTVLIQYPMGLVKETYTIPNTVIEIDAEAFVHSSFSSIIIPDGVEEIGMHAFAYCSKLTSITISDSVIFIGTDAFYKTKYYNNEDNWKNSLLYIGNHLVAAREDIQNYSIKKGTTVIAENSFSYSDCITTVAIPDSITHINYGAFAGCNNLTDVYYSGSEEEWNNISIGNYNNPLLNATIHFNVAPEDEETYIEQGKCGDDLDYTLSKDGTLTITGTGDMTNYSWSSVAPWCDNRSSIKTVTIGDGVTSIGTEAFSECSSLTSVTIGDDVTSIGMEAFSKCSSLTSVTIGDGVTSIGEGAFSDCSNLTSITIPDSVTCIGWSAFYCCSNLTSILIPDSVTSIDPYAFYCCSSLTSVTIGDGVTSIGGHAFYCCSNLTSILIPDSVTSIGSRAFSGSGLTSVTISDSVTSIGEEAFICSSITSITVDTNNEYYSSDEYGALFNKDKTELIQYPIGNERTSYTIPNSVISIGYRAFDNCSSLTSITIPDSVTSIGYEAFADCSSLTSVVIPDSVTSIGDYAFCKCSSLIEITIPEHLLANINDTVFEGCNLEKINVRSSTIDGVYDISIDIINTDKLPNSVKLEEAGYSSNVLIIQNDDGVSIGSTDLSKISNIIVSYGSDPGAPIDSHKIYICTSDGTVLGSAQLSQKGDFWAKGQRAVIIPVSTDYSGEIVIKKDEPGHMIAIDKIILTYGFGEGTIVEGGTCGENLTWTLDDNGTLTISGTGYMTNYYSWSSDAPWYNNRSSVKSVVISDGVTSIGERAFADCSSLTSITIPVSVTIIYDYAFSGCNNLTDVYYNGSKKKWNNISLGTDNECLLNATLHLTNIPAEILYGDSNGDGAVNGKDVLTLRKYMVNYDYDTGTSSVEVSSGADANGDGVINGKDVLLMRKYMVNYDYETGTSSVKLGPSLPELPDGFTLIDISELEKTFLTDHPDLIPGQKDRHFGVISKNGDIVVPFEYDGIVSPTSDGYTLVVKQSTEIIDGEEVIAYDDYLFDKDGKVVYSTHSYDWPYEHKNERLGFYQNGLIITYKRGWDSEWECMTDDYTYYLRRLDGSLIRTIENVLQSSPDSAYAECIVLPTAFNGTMLIDFNGNIISEYSSQYEEFYSNGLCSGIFGDYYMAGYRATRSVYLVKSDGSETYNLKNEDTFSVIGHYGKTIIAKPYGSGKYVLLDAAILDTLSEDYDDPTWYSEAIISEYEYDYISCRIFRDRDEKYFCVSRDGKDGYLSYDLKTEVLYDEASEFINGKAIIREGDKFYVINDSFEKISDEITGYSDFRLSVMGENMYTLTKGDTVYLLIHDCE